jgi:hypothetical protein
MRQEAMRGVVRVIDRRLAAECDHAQAARLMTAAFILTGLRILDRLVDAVLNVSSWQELLATP